MKLPPRDQMVMGVHAIRELLVHAPSRLLKIYTVRPSGDRKSDLLALCQDKGIPIVFSSLDELTKMAGSDSHQSFVAHVKGREFLDAKEFFQKIGDQENCLVLMTDQIFDPQNFGALMRCAECLGASALIWSKNRGTDLTPTAAKASCGASEILPLLRVSNLADTAEQFKKEGFEVIASLLDPKAESAFTFRFAPRTLLIVGSEGEGIQPLLQKKSDRLIYIPMAGKIESLNVAQAASVLLTLWKCSGGCSARSG
ncbi:MAG: 23S rRNA (guanosine(2251)-2'-O)-methyltransferase RlmB [Verrucomicrobia bacterium]|nr:23S rRNA (guanosine(2251)-2'-O)-methyltransferase RlmB [Verrucomicrobiota bacterium]